MANPMRRKLKNVINQYSDAQVKVREATSNDPWGPSSTLMSEVADMTYNVGAFSEVMSMIWKRLNDSGKNWRHVYKALVVLEYILKTGSERVAQQCRENIYAIQTLRDFQHLEDNKDQGVNVREKSKQLVALLKDEERLKQERSKALKAKERFAQSNAGIGSGGSGMQQSASMNFTRQHSGGSAPSLNGGGYNDHHPGRRSSASDLEQARPSTVGEEELQLQLALAISKEEADQDTQKKRGDDVRLAIALEESQKGKADGKLVDAIAENRPNALNQRDDFWQSSSTGAGAGIAQVQNDPWAPAPPPTDEFIAQNDPWAAATVAPISDPWGNNQVSTSASSHDPWAPTVAKSSSTTTGFTVPDSSSNQRLDDVEFEILSARSTSSNHNNIEGMQIEQMTAPQKSKSPQDFLGANSSLVNLDNLVTKPQKGTNPFASGETNSNPFMAVQTQQTRPTLNQMQYQTRTDFIQQQQGVMAPQNLEPQSNILQPTQNPFM